MYAHEHFPWCQQQLEAGKLIVVSCIDDVPAEAARDQEVWRQLGIKTTLTFPLSFGEGQIIGALSFNTMLSERTWPEALIKRLQLVAQMFTNALIRKQTEAVLRESEVRLSLATEAVGAGLWIMDVDTKKVWVSPKSRELFHFGPDEEINYESYFRVIHPEDRDRVNQEVQHALRSGEPLLCDYRIVLPDGSIRWIVARGQRFLKSSGEPGRIMGLSFDITDRKELELQLSESQALLTSLVHSTSDMIWSVDSEHFGLLTFNRSLIEYFLHNHGIHIKAGMRPEDLLPTEDYAQQWHMFYQQALDEGSFTTEYQVSGGTRALRLNLNTLRRDKGVFGVSVFAQDITERKQMETQLQNHLREIENLKQRLESENIYLCDEVRQLKAHDEIVGESDALGHVLAKAQQVATTESTVLIMGETGTGKELLARAIHNMSRRKDRTLITLNCASLPATLIESELFGREKGAYTGALTRMTGRFEVADSSTLFLDEIGDLPIEMQGKLLRVLEYGIFERLGSTRAIRVNVRIIAATNRNLSQEVKEGRFRKDLYYRLNVFPITLPPLRDRKEDITPLVWAFVRQLEKPLGKHIGIISKKSMDALISYPWPGNIRELRNVIEHAMIMSTTTTLDILPPALTGQDTAGASVSLEDMERRHILEALNRTNWRISGKNSASEILGMKRTTLQSRMKMLGITRPASS
jgi:PAS domain S-box-containing protein